MLSRTRVVSVAIIIAVFVSGDLLYAQRSRGGRSGPGGFGMGPGGPPGMGGAVMLAGNPAVQKEIDLDRDGAEKVGKLTESYMQEAQSEWEKAGFGRDTFSQLGSLTPDERAAKQREIAEKSGAIMTRLQEKFVPQLKETLSPSQYERLQQIHWQA
ncbi:MAG TPA: hypothetical protein VKU82_10115, partial [Planctomycetaceae bacterium]|nr:hypothetical protein [Planctomycetaceae bacterium]